MKQNRDWIGAGAGFLFVVLTVVGLSVGGNHPDATGPIEPIRSYFLADPFGIQAGSYIQAVAVLFLVVFGASIARRFWLAGKQLAAAVAFGAVLLAVGLDLIENALLSVLAFSVAGDGDAGAIKGLYALRQPILLALPLLPPRPVRLRSGDRHPYGRRLSTLGTDGSPQWWVCSS